jgi:nucleoside-diphosphate kinase
MNRTLVICKPDAVERGLVGEIIARLERKGLTLVAAELRTIAAETAAKHYAEHRQALLRRAGRFITRGPAMAMVVEGPEDTWKVVRTLMGQDQPVDDAAARHHPRRPRHRDHREPGPRLRRPRVGRARDRLWFPDL